MYVYVYASLLFKEDQISLFTIISNVICNVKIFCDLYLLHAGVIIMVQMTMDALCPAAWPHGLSVAIFTKIILLVIN